MAHFYYYELYGQRVKSELFLAEAEPLAEFTDYDVLIDIGPPPDWVRTLCKTQYDYLTEEVMWFYLEELLLFYVEHGNHIRIYKEDPAIQDITISSYLNGSAFSLLLMQKKIIPIHGSALSYKDKACIISGPSGSGKSSTAMELMKKDFLFMADDIAAITMTKEHGPILHPGPPWQKMCGNQLSPEEKDAYLFIDENRDKYARRLQSSYEKRSLPPVALFIILKEEREDLLIQKLQGVEKLHALTHNLYRGDIYHRFGVSPERMQFFLNLAKSMEIYHILRPMGKDTLHDITELVLKEFLQSC